MPDIRAIVEQKLLELLPQDGTPVPNRVLRALIGQRLGQLVSEDLYFSVRDQLVENGRIARSRGAGGKVSLIQAPAPDQSPPEEADWSEASLMARLEQYLKGPFQLYLDLPEGSRCWVRDVSAIGPRSGQWARPDFVLISASRYRFLPEIQVDVHGFELKPASGGSVQAVSEALAQTRFTHYGHLVWHVRPESRAEIRVSEVETYCEHHGIGLILIRDPTDLNSFEIRCDAERKPTPAPVVDDFLESRLCELQKHELESFLRGIRS